MNFNSKTNKLGSRIISMIIAIVMTMSLALVNVSADDVDTSEETEKHEVDTSKATEEHRAKIGIDYLGDSTSGPATTAQTVPDLSGTSTGIKYLWFGVYLSGLKTMSDYYKSIEDTDGTGGITKFSVEVEYASSTTSGIVYRTSAQAPISNADNAWYADFPGWKRSYTYVDPDMGMDETAIVKDSYNVSYTDPTKTLTTDGREPEVIRSDSTPQSVRATVQVKSKDSGALGAKSRIFGDVLTNDKQYMVIFCFALPANRTIAPGTPLISLGRNTMLTFETAKADGTTLFTSAWHTSRTNTPAGNLKNYFDFQGDLELAPLAADHLKVTQPASYALAQQFAGNKFAHGITELTAYGDAAETTSEKVTLSNANFYYVDKDASVTDASFTDDNKIDTDTVLVANTHNNKDIYVVAKGCFLKLGTLTVAADSVSSITIKAAGTNVTSATDLYDSQSIVSRLTGNGAKTLTVTYKMASEGSSATGTDAAYSTFTANKLTLAMDNGSGGLKAVTTNDKMAVGTNTYYVVPTDKLSETGIKSKDYCASFTVTAAKDVLQIQSLGTSGTAVPASALNYAEGGKIDFKDVTLRTKMASANASNGWGNYKVSVTGATKFIFYLGNDNTPANNAYGDGTGKTVITSGTTTYSESAHKDKFVYAVPADNTTNTGGSNAPILIGQLATRSVSSVTAVSDAPTGLKHGDTLGGLATQPKFSVNYSDGTNSGNTPLTLAELNSAGVNLVIDGKVITATTPFTVAMASKNITFYKGGTVGADGTLSGGTAVTGTGAIATTKFAVGKKDVKVQLDTTNTTNTIEKVYDKTKTVEAADKPTIKLDTDAIIEADLKSTTVSGLDFEYDSADAGNTIAIKVTGTAAAAALADNYTLVLDTADFTTANGKTTLANVTGKITAKQITLTAADLGNMATLVIGGTHPITNQSVNVTSTTNSDVETGDTVPVTYTLTYDDPNTAANPASGKASDFATTSTNYSIANTGDLVVSGEVTDKEPTSISVADYTLTYPDTTFAPTVTTHFDGGTTSTTTSVTYTVKDTGAAFNLDDVAYGDTVKLTATYTKNDSSTLTADFDFTKAKKTISGAEIVFTVSKGAGQPDSTAVVTPVFTTVEGTDELTIASCDVAYAATANADGTYDVTITNIVLGGADADKYELNPNSGTGTGTVSTGSQSLEGTLTFERNAKTNDITVTYTAGAADVKSGTLMYSKDGGATWQESNVFTGLTQDTDYTFAVKADATETDAESNTVTGTQRTYKYQVAAYAKNATTTTYRGYTDDATVASNAAITAIVGSIARLEAFYTDAACTTAIDFTTPYALTAGAETKVYYTTTSGGGGIGGGGAVTYTVKFSAGAHGKIVKDSKDTVKVESGKTVKDLPTIEADEGYRFIGWSTDGKEVADLDKLTIKATTTLTALYEEVVEETPAPTEKPTLIDTRYTKAYATGYEDGTFRAEANITRAELAAMIARLSNGGDIADGAYRASFFDVEDDAWFNKYIGYLEQYNVLTGYEDGSFLPYDIVTRSELSAVIARAQKFDLIDEDGLFYDVTDDAWAKAYITTLAKKDIVTGYPDGSFGVNSLVKRAEAVTMINRLFDKSTAVVTFTPSDIAGHWAEADIMLAVNDRQMVEED